MRGQAGKGWRGFPVSGRNVGESLKGQRVLRNGCSAIQSRKNTISEGIGSAHGRGGAAMRDGSSRVMRPGSRAHVTRVNGLNHVLRVGTVVRPDYGRGFGGLFGENAWRKGKCMKISAFGCIYHDQGQRVNSKFG